MDENIFMFTNKPSFSCLAGLAGSSVSFFLLEVGKVETFLTGSQRLQGVDQLFHIFLLHERSKSLNFLKSGLILNLLPAADEARYYFHRAADAP